MSNSLDSSLSTAAKATVDPHCAQVAAPLLRLMDSDSENYLRPWWESLNFVFFHGISLQPTYALLFWGPRSSNILLVCCPCFLTPHDLLAITTDQVGPGVPGCHCGVAALSIVAPTLSLVIEYSSPGPASRASLGRPVPQ